MERYVIINADDFGMCRSANLAVFDLFKKGGITSATIMTPCSWAPEAAAFARDNPEFAIGIHLTFTSEWSKYRWAPVNSENTASLRDADGYMYSDSKDFEKNGVLEEVEAEARAQIERIKKLGLTNPSHLDNHMGSIYGIETGRLELLTLAFDLASEYNLPFRFPATFTDEQFENTMLGINIPKELVLNMFKHYAEYAKEKKVAIPDYLLPNEWNGPQAESFENFREYIYAHFEKFPEGVTETYIHPAVESDELKGTSSVWKRRVWEYQLFADPKTRQHFEAIGIKLINYRDLKKMRGY